MVGLENYSNGFDADAQNAGDLIKAMQAGQITGRDTTGLGLTQEPLKVESLETALKVLDYRTADIKLYNALPKLTAYNTVEEYLQLSSYGSERGGFYDEGELSDVEDSTYIRRAEHVKYMQVTGEVTLQAQMVRSYVDAMKQEVQNKMMWIMRLANKTLTKGDADVIPQEFNSIFKQHQSVGAGNGSLYADNAAYYDSQTVIDMRGASIKQESIERGAVLVDSNYGTPTDFFGPTSVISALSQDYYNRQRFMFSGSASPVGGTLGTVPQAIATTLGNINLHSDKFMKAGEARFAVNGATSPSSPAAPVVSGVTVVSDPGKSKFVAGDAGNVYYAVAAINKKGESPLAVFATALTLAVGSSIDIALTPGAGSNPASGFVVYRTEKTIAGSATGLAFYPIFKVGVSAAAAGYEGGAAGVIRDRGIFLPNTEQAFITQMTEDVMSWKQLAPMSKLDLAVLAMSRRFIVFQFGTPVLYSPRKMVRYINVGRSLSA
jgi:hypothetical protein